MNRIAGMLIAIVALAAVAAGDARAEQGPKLVARVYPGAVTEYTKAGQRAQCGDNENAYCFLTRDSAAQVTAFYAQEGVKLERIPAAGLGGGRSNIELALRFQLEENAIGALVAAPVEFYQTTGSADTPSYFNGVAVMTPAPKRALPGADKAALGIVSSDPILGAIAVAPEKAAFMAALGGLQLDPARLVPHYNRHLPMLAGYFQSVDGEPLPRRRLAELHQRSSAPTFDAAASQQSEDQASDARAALSRELKDLLKRRPAKRMDYAGVQLKMAQQMGAGDTSAKANGQAELDKILMSEPELAAWKHKRDALDRQTQSTRARADGAADAKQKAQQQAQGDPEQQSRAVGAYLDGLDKEVYSTRILIHASEGKRVKRDAATVQGEWRAVAGTFK
jgi:hypothetical protein